MNTAMTDREMFSLYTPDKWQKGEGTNGLRRGPGTKECWTQAIVNYSGEGPIVVAQVYGYSIEEVQFNIDLVLTSLRRYYNPIKEAVDYD